MGTMPKHRDKTIAMMSKHTVMTVILVLGKKPKWKRNFFERIWVLFETQNTMCTD